MSMCWWKKGHWVGRSRSHPDKDPASPEDPWYLPPAGGRVLKERKHAIRFTKLCHLSRQWRQDSFRSSNCFRRAPLPRANVYISKVRLREEAGLVKIWLSTEPALAALPKGERGQQEPSYPGKIEVSPSFIEHTPSTVLRDRRNNSVTPKAEATWMFLSPHAQGSLGEEGHSPSRQRGEAPSPPGALVTGHPASGHTQASTHNTL